MDTERKRNIPDDLNEAMELLMWHVTSGHRENIAKSEEVVKSLRELYAEDIQEDTWRYNVEWVLEKLKEDLDAAYKRTTPIPEYRYLDGC